LGIIGLTTPPVRLESPKWIEAFEAPTVQYIPTMLIVAMINRMIGVACFDVKAIDVLLADTSSCDT